jgi:hypothetical protein
MSIFVMALHLRNQVLIAVYHGLWKRSLHMSRSTVGLLGASSPVRDEVPGELAEDFLAPCRREKPCYRAAEQRIAERHRIQHVRVEGRVTLKQS